MDLLQGGGGELGLAGLVKRQREFSSTGALPGCSLRACRYCTIGVLVAADAGVRGAEIGEGHGGIGALRRDTSR